MHGAVVFENYNAEGQQSALAPPGQVRTVSGDPVTAGSRSTVRDASATGSGGQSAEPSYAPSVVPAASETLPPSDASSASAWPAIGSFTPPKAASFTKGAPEGEARHRQWYCPSTRSFPFSSYAREGATRAARKKGDITCRKMIQAPISIAAGCCVGPWRAVPVRCWRRRLVLPGRRGCERPVTSGAKSRAPGGAAFPKDFVWGVATAAYQVEGAAAEDGRGPSVWDVFCKKPGAVFEETFRRRRLRPLSPLPGGRGADEEAGRPLVPLQRVLDPRVPEGTGATNDKGGRFLQAAGSTSCRRRAWQPMCTLFHWDYPQALYKRGGWFDRNRPLGSPTTRRWSADKLGDRIKVWATLNEPQCFIGMGNARRRSRAWRQAGRTPST